MQEEEKSKFQNMEKHKEKKKKNKKDRKTDEHNVIEQSEEIEVDVMDINKDHDMEEIRAEEKNELRKIEKHKEKKKKKKKKDRKTDKSNVVEQSEEIEVDATDVNKDHDVEEIKVASKKRDKKKNRCSEAEDDPTVLDGRGSNGQGSRTDVENDEQDANLDSRKDSKKEKKKKKQRNSEKGDDVSSSSNLLLKGHDVMNDNDERIGGKKKDKGRKKRESDKNKEVDKASAKVGGLPESFETVIDDRQKRAGNVKTIEPEKNTNHEGGITMLEDVKKRNRKDKYSEVSTFSLAKAGINGSGNGKVHVVAVDKEPGCDEECEGSNGYKRKKRKHAKVNTGSERAENGKRKRVKQALSAEDTETAENGVDGIPSTLRINKKTKRKKEKGDSEEGSLKFLSEGGSKNDMNAGDAEDKENEETSNMMKERRAGDSKASLSKGKKRRVSFSGKVEVFPLDNDTEHDEIKLVQGKRFTKEEDEIIKAAIEKYLEKYELGEDGKHMILNYRSCPEVKDCWKEIGTCIPYRPRKSVSYRAHVILQQSEERKWDPEDYDRIRSFHKKHGSKWKELAEQLGKHRIHVKDAWRRIKPPNLRKGQWSQEEYQSLFDLVNVDLQMKVFQEKKSKHGMLKDNISWEAIGEKLSTRSSPDCCTKWYKQLTSSLVNQGIWSDADDYRLLDALQNTCLLCRRC